MDDSFFIYLEQLELLLFFSGYLLIYLLVHALAETGPAKKIFKKNIARLLPFTYAVVGVLYLGFLLKGLYPDYSFSHIIEASKIPGLKIWGLLSVLFFIPALARKPVYSLLHSLVFVFFILRDLYLFLFKTLDKSLLKNDMNLYMYSLLINMLVFLFVVGISSLYIRLQNKKIG